MKIRTKSIIVIAIVAFLIFGVLHLVAAFVIQPSFRNLEIQDSKQSLTQAVSILNYRLNQLKGSVRDYASWDDTYEFVQNTNQEYIENNFVESTFENLNLNLIAIVSNNQSLLYCQSFEQNNLTKVQTLNETKNTLTTDSALWAFPSTENAVTGIMLLDNQPMFIAATPILTSSNQGPAEAGLLFGRYIDSDELGLLKEITNLNFEIDTLPNFELKNNQIAASLKSNVHQVVVKENSFDLVSGYMLIDDIHFEPLFVLQVSQARTDYQQGVWLEYIFLAASLVLTITLGVALIFLLERSIVKPLTTLASNVEAMPLNLAVLKPKSKFGTEEITIVDNAMRNNLNKKFEAMNEVSRMVAHDLRNPLTGIKGASYYLKHSKTDLTETDNAMLQTIDDCVEYSNKIVSDLLEYSCEIRMNKIEVSLKMLVNNCLSTLVVPSNVEVINKVNAEFLVSVDKVKIERVFGNLIKNAIDAMPNGGKLEITSKKVNNQVKIDFSDEGVGMSKEALAKLWTPFFTTKAKGMGIGLSICKRLIEAHGGKIEVETTLGKGSIFAVFLALETR